MPQTRPLFEQIDSWLQEIDTVKTAAAPAKQKTKKAATKKAGPDGMGESDHPSDDVDDNTQDNETGERYTENSEDVKQDVPGQAVDETDPDSGGDQDDKQFNIGTQQSATGEDASVEDDYKGDKDDPGTSHPADAESTGEKYGSMQLKQLLKVAEDRAHSILADLANGIGTGNGVPVVNQQTKKAAAQNKTAAKAAAKAAAKVEPVQQTQPVPVPSFDMDFNKIAADYVAQTIRDAEFDADLVGSYLHSYTEGRQKAAEGEVDPALAAALAGGGGGPPPEGGEDEGGPPPEGAGGEVIPPPGAGEGAGGPGAGANVLGALGAAGGPPPGAEAGGPPPGAEGGAGGGMNEEQALQELAMALQELGIDPAQLAQEAQGQGAKLASAVTAFKRAGRFRFAEAKTAAQRQTREQIKDYIRELTGSK